MRIKYGGNGIRRIEDLQWEKSNGYVVDVPGDMVAEVLTQPNEPFFIADDEPMRQLEDIREGELVELALCSIGDFRDLAELSPRQKKLFFVDPQRLDAWIEQARSLIHSLSLEE